MVADTKKPTFYLKPPPKGMGELRKDVKDYTKTQRKGLRTSGDSFTGKGCMVCSLSNNGGIGNNVSFRTNRRPLAIVGSNITEEEYKSGRLFSGKTGNLIREIMISTLIRSACELPNEWIDQNVAYLKAVRCKGVATVAEAHACWKHLEADLMAVDPDVILVTGGLAFNIMMQSTWADSVTDSSAYHGMSFPLFIAGRTRLVVTTIDSIEAVREVKGKEQPSEAFFFADDIRIAIQLVLENACPPTVDWKKYLFPFYRNDTATEIAPGVTVKGERLLLVFDIDNGYDEAWRWIERMLSTGIPSTKIGFDIETNGIKPYDGSRMISYAISDGFYTVSVLADHYSVRQDRDKVNKSLELLKRFLVSDIDYVLTAHNLMFEMEWMYFYFGAAVARKRRFDPDQTKYFACTLAGKFRIAADRYNRHLSLDAVTCQTFGFDLKEMYAVDRERMELYQADIVLEYNAGDAIVVPYIAEQQAYTMKNVLFNFDAYRVSIGSALSYSIMAGHGMPVNLVAANTLAVPFRTELLELEKDIADTSTYRDFAAAKGRPPDWQSSDDMAFILYDMFKVPPIYNKKTGQLSADKHVVSLYEEQLPDLQLVVQMKEAQRFINVTVNTLVQGRAASGKVVVSPDGLIHTEVKAFQIPTDRSSTTPNLQNGSKRNKRLKRARDVYGLDPKQAKGKTFLLADAAQIDFRFAGISCLDRNFVNATREDLDIHATMAAHWASLDPVSFAHIAVYLGVTDTLYHDKNVDKKKVLKEMRQRVKSGLVFARIYRAGLSTIARTLETTLEIAEALVAILDGMFPRIAEWHADLQKFYQKNKCIRSVTGNTLWGPLNFGDIYNYGIQSATAFAVKTMMRTLTIEYELQLVAEVHDELVFMVNTDEVEDLIPIIGKTFCDLPYDWTKVVPLGCEVSVSDPQDYGNGWGSIKEVAKFSSKDFGWEETPVEDYEVFYRRQFEPIVRRPTYYIGASTWHQQATC